MKDCLAKKVLDIDEFIDEIKRMNAESYILKKGGVLFFGKIILNFERGRIDHIEKTEFVK